MMPDPLPNPLQTSKMMICRYCGQNMLQWWELAPGVWRPYDVLRGELHQCKGKELPPRQPLSLTSRLITLGFSYYAVAPAESQANYRHALIRSNLISSLYVLFRESGVDIRVFTPAISPELNDDGMLLLADGETIHEPHEGYVRSQAFELIMQIANQLVDDELYIVPMEELIVALNECHYLPAEEFVCNLRFNDDPEQDCMSFVDADGAEVDDAEDENDDDTEKDTFRFRRFNKEPEDMEDFYWNMAPDNSGADVYLGDGMWIDRNGDLHDR